MSSWVKVIDRIVQRISVAVELLWVYRVWYNAIWRDHSVYIRQVIARVHIYQPQVVGAAVIVRVPRVAPVGYLGFVPGSVRQSPKGV